MSKQFFLKFQANSQISQERRNREKAEQMVKSLNQQISILQEQVKTAMNKDVREARVQWEAG